MPCYLRSVYGWSYADVPEHRLITQELTWSELQSLMGYRLAMEYIRVAPPIVIWRWMYAPFRDPLTGPMVNGGWHGRCGFGVQSAGPYTLLNMPALSSW